jgi:hypothetical protein
MSGSACITLGLLGVLNFYAAAGEIKPGSVPGSLNYQGRLERDNAPITGPVFLTFRIYNAVTGGDPAACGNPGAACRWAGPEAVVNAAQGIFSASITPPLSVFSAGEPLYLEVQVESDILSPREPLNSVAYSFAAKKLEDGASVSVSTLTAAYQVLLATAPDSKVGIGTVSPTHKLTVDGVIKLNGVGSAICYNDNTCTSSFGVATAIGGVTAAGDSLMASGTGGAGKMSFTTSGVERLRINDSTLGGTIAVGPGAIASPNGAVDIDGALYVSNAGGIHDRNDGEVNIKGGLLVESGRVTGAGGEYISLGETDNTISLVSGGSERLRVHSNGNVGIGVAAPAAGLHAAGDIRSNAGVRGGTVSIGSYNGDWTGLANEIRGQTDLLLQQSSSYNVGIGTNTPREKLHVSGSIRTDQGIIAATAAFSDSVRVDLNGDFTANSGHGNKVYLSSTVIYGSLTVTGGIGSMAGDPAYLALDNIFTGQNSFLGRVTVSSDIAAGNRVGVGVRDFDFTAPKYLQIGDNKPEFDGDEAAAYLVSGNSADSKIYFYRGASEAARFETQAGNNLALVVGNTKSLVDGSYYRVQNSVVWISTGYATTPAIYVSSSLGNVGMGAAVLDPNHRLTVEGNIRISTSSSPGRSYGLIFADGTTLNSANPGGLSVGSVSNNNDAVVQSDQDSNGTGSVILRAGTVDGLVLNSGGNVGIGTISPISKLNLRGGDLVLGSPSIGSYASNGVEDLIIAGSIVVDGGFVQRSATPVVFTGLTVAGNVYLSTSAAGRAGVGTDAPGYKLDVQGGDINASGAIRTGGATRITAAGDWNGAAITVPYGGTGQTTLTSGGILYGNGAGGIGALGVMTNGQLLIGDGAGAPSVGALTGTGNQVVVTNGAGTITLSLPQDIHTAANPTFNNLTLSSLTGMLNGNGAGALTAITGVAGRTARWATAGDLDASAVLYDDGSNAGVGVAPTAGIKLDVNGKLRTTTFQLTGVGVNNYVLTSDANGNASWANPASGGLGDGWVGNEVTDAADATLTRSGLGTAVSPYKLAVNLGNTNTWTAAQTFNGGLSGTLTGSITGNAATVTNGVYTTGTYSDPAWITSIAGSKVSGNISGNAANVTGTIPVVNGGTGQTTLTSGGILYGNGTGGIGALAVMTNGQLLIGDGTGAPAIATLTGTANQVAVGNGAGTITLSLPQNVHAAATPTFAGLTLSGLTGVLKGNGAGALTAANVNLTSEVTGALPVGNGGTGITSAGATGKVVCWTATATLGVCSTAPDVNGVCTCN